MKISIKASVLGSPHAGSPVPARCKTGGKTAYGVPVLFLSLDGSFSERPPACSRIPGRNAAASRDSRRCRSGAGCMSPCRLRHCKERLLLYAASGSAADDKA